MMGQMHVFTLIFILSFLSFQEKSEFYVMSKMHGLVWAKNEVKDHTELEVVERGIGFGSYGNHRGW